MRTTVDLPEPLLRNAKRRAAQIGTTLSEVVGDALRQHLNSQTKTATPKFKLITFEGGQVNPGIDLNRTSALIVEDDIQEYKNIVRKK